MGRASRWRRTPDHHDRAAAILDAAIDSVITMDLSGRVVGWNPAAEQTFGYSSEQAVGEDLAELIVPPAFRERHRAALARYRDTGTAGRLMGRRVELNGMHADGRVFPIELSLTRIEGAALVAAVVRDITERVQQQAQLSHQALHDPLTGVANRRLFEDRLDGALSRARRSGARTALMFVDLDGFKDVNDRHGHRAGDRVLDVVAERLRESLRPTDTVARIGGDEFAVVCEEVRVEEALAIASRLRQSVEVPLRYERISISVSTSIGVAFVEGGRSTSEALLAEADAAMYRAKLRGSGRIEVFEEEMRPRRPEETLSADELERAIELGELVVAYQPVIDVAAGGVVGAEALVRWDHPRWGRLLPDRFLPLAEETGLIEPIGALVLRQACAQAARWTARTGASRFGIAVNCSPAQLSSPGFAALVEEVLGSCQPDPVTLWLEVTEAAIARGAASPGSALAAVSDMGVRIAIDDFGIGFSSLAHLRKLPVDAVKVDRALVEGVGRSSDDTAIVTAVTEMAHALELDVVAEGVESEPQADALRVLGCDRAQGYFFGRPEVPERGDELLAAA